jgi:hypothetical protein
MDFKPINKAFMEAYNNIAHKFNDAEETDELTLDQCSAMASALLKEPKIPIFCRIRTCLLSVHHLYKHTHAQWNL